MEKLEEIASYKPQEEAALLDIRGLCVEYHADGEIVHAVNNLSLTLRKGENLGLVGETGAGKTTTAYSVLQIIASPPGKIIKGEIFFEGRDLLKEKGAAIRSIRGNDISMIFQDPMTSLNPVYCVGDQIAEVIRLHAKVSKAQARQQAEEMLELVGIPKERYTEFPHQFSGGMKQRVVIAMSIACTPKLLLADEPTTALDVTIQAQVLELMNELKQKLNTSLLLITHDLGVVAQVCDNVAIMYAGEIVEYGSVGDIYDDTRHPYTMGLFESIPTLDETSDKLTPIKGQMPDPTNLPTGCAFHPRCPHANQLCMEEKPDMICVGGTHVVKCHIASGQAKMGSAGMEEGHG